MSKWVCSWKANYGVSQQTDLSSTVHEVLALDRTSVRLHCSDVTLFHKDVVHAGSFMDLDSCNAFMTGCYEMKSGVKYKSRDAVLNVTVRFRH